MPIRRMAMSIAALCLLLPGGAFAEGYRTTLTGGGREFDVCVVRGTPYEMGRAFGELMAREANLLTTRMLLLSQAADPEQFSDEALDAAWGAVAPHTSERVKEELRGLADGSGLELATLQRVHAIPLVSAYSCSSVALWGDATANGNLYLTRSLDWNMAVRAHEFACVVVYIPDEGLPHVNFSFAGYAGCNTGMNAAGLALAEMGDSPSSDKPYDLDGAHFTFLFRDMLYEARALDEALDMLRNAQRIKKYHYVIGSGSDKRAAKIRAHEELDIWFDNDPADEYAPNIVENCVYNDEGRGAFGPIQAQYGEHTHETVIDIVKRIPIEGANVLNVVYDATGLEFWVSYANGATEAYELPFVHGRFADYAENFEAALEKAEAASPAH